MSSSSPSCSQIQNSNKLSWAINQIINHQVHDVITFEAGQSELEYEMEIVDDDEWEPDEEFYVKVNIMMMLMIMNMIMMILMMIMMMMIIMMIIDMRNGSPTRRSMSRSRSWVFRN